MSSAIDRYFPTWASFTRPDGGMFHWVTLPREISALALFPIALEKKVLFVPGDPFYIGKTNVNVFRLNFSCAEESEIEEGIRRLGEAMRIMGA